MWATGIGAWWNHFTSMTPEDVAERAAQARVKFVIVKWGYPAVERALTALGVPWATERYVYRNQPKTEGNWLANAVDAGAKFAVINAEENPGGWATDPSCDGAMRELIETFRLRHPHVELYASIDTRGNRLTAYPGHQVLLELADGVMPMIYPGAFRPHQPSGYIERAFADAVDGKDFKGQPVFPTVQTYEWTYGGVTRRLGANGVREQAEECRERGYTGWQAYTVGRASDTEWDAVAQEVGAVPQPPLVPGPHRADRDFAAGILYAMARKLTGKPEGAVDVDDTFRILRYVYEVNGWEVPQ